MAHPIGSGKPVAYDQRRCPVWISVAEAYEHQHRTAAAKKVLDELGWPVKCTRLKAPGDPSEWPPGLEQGEKSSFVFFMYFCSFFLTQRCGLGL
jgi:hypothetical protein